MRTLIFCAVMAADSTSCAVQAQPVLASIPIVACVSTPKPRCWTETAIYSTGATTSAPREAPMPKGKP